VTGLKKNEKFIALLQDLDWDHLSFWHDFDLQNWIVSHFDNKKNVIKMIKIKGLPLNHKLVISISKND
jgi:hypothetical protein